MSTVNSNIFLLSQRPSVFAYGSSSQLWYFSFNTNITICCRCYFFAIYRLPVAKSVYHYYNSVWI